MKQSINLCALQHPFFGDEKSTLEYIYTQCLNAANNAKSKGAPLDIIALQELHSSAYFCQSESVGAFKLAESYQKQVEFFSDVAKKTNAVLITSLFEKRAKGLYHNTAVVFERDGSIAGKYRKMHIPDDPSFYEKFYFTPGDLGFNPIKTSAGNLGVLVCWDQWYPEAARIMALKGADMLIYPTAIGYTPSDSAQEKSRQLEAWKIIQRAHSVANALPLVAINRCGFEVDSSGIGEGIEFWGNSFISGAQGEILAESNNKQDILICNIDLAHTQEVRQIWPFLRDRRIDAYGEILRRFCD